MTTVWVVAALLAFGVAGIVLAAARGGDAVQLPSARDDEGGAS